MNCLRYIFWGIMYVSFLTPSIAQNIINDSLLCDRWQIIGGFKIQPIEKNKSIILYKNYLSIEYNRFQLGIYDKWYQDLDFMILAKNKNSFFERRWEVGYHGMLDPITKPPYKVELIKNWKVVGDTLKMLREAPLYRKKGTEVKERMERILFIDNAIMITSYYHIDGKIKGLSLYRRASIPEEKIPFFQNDYSMYEFALPFIKADYPDIMFIEED